MKNATPTLETIRKNHEFLIALSFYTNDATEDGYLDQLDSIIYSTCNKDVSNETTELVQKLKTNINHALNILEADAKRIYDKTNYENATT